MKNKIAKLINFLLKWFIPVKTVDNIKLHGLDGDIRDEITLLKHNILDFPSKWIYHNSNNPNIRAKSDLYKNSDLNYPSIYKNEIYLESGASPDIILTENEQYYLSEVFDKLSKIEELNQITISNNKLKKFKEMIENI